MENIYQLSPEMTSLSSGVICLSKELQKIEELKIQHGQEDKFCCINVSEQKSINNALNDDDQDFSTLILIACENSELLDFWRKNSKNFQPQGFKIVKVYEYCDIYSKVLLRRLIEYCETL